MDIISQGAEAIISKDKGFILKERVKKSYRLEELDKTLRKRRTKSEAKLLRDAKRAGIFVPQVIEEDNFSIKMEYIEGSVLRDFLNEKNAAEIGKKIGQSVGKLHDLDIIHGDLTTSNMIFRNFNVFFIDFGLGFYSKRIEDRAVDLHLLKEAVQATHSNISEILWDSVLEAYSSTYGEAEKVIKTLALIEKRGRYAQR